MQNLPQTLGPYRVEALVARGGQGQVFRGVDPRDGRPVALKLLLGARSGAGAERFAREVQAVRGLSHPHVVRCYDAGHERGVPFLALEWIDGDSLEQVLRREGPLPIAEVIRIGRALCDAVAHLHDRGLLHRDLKPDNVLLARDGRVVLADFGLVFDVDPGQDSLTATGNMLGTPGYWPPEQALGQRGRIGVGSDVYGVGAVLYAALTAQPPRAATSVDEALAALEAPVTPPRALRPDVPAHLDALVLECLASDPAERPTTARVVQRRLNEAPQPASRGASSRRAAWPTAVAGLVLTLGVVGLAAWLTRGGPPTPATPPGVVQPPPAWTTSVIELTPLDGRDTHVRGYGFYTNDNYEGFPTLRVGFRTQGRASEAWIYLRLPALGLDGDLRRASLRLYAGGSLMPEVDLAVYPVVGTWLEGSGTFDDVLDGMAWGPEGATGSFPERFTRAACADEPVCVVPSPRAHGWFELDVTPALERWERDPTLPRVICLRPVATKQTPNAWRVAAIAGRHSHRERWPQLVIEHTGAVALPRPFDERWRAHRKAVRSELADLRGAARERRLGELLRETPGDIWLRVQRGGVSLARGDAVFATRDLQAARDLSLADWTEREPGLPRLARQVLQAQLGTLEPRTALHAYNAWVVAWEVAEPGDAPEPFPETSARRQVLQMRALAYPRIANLATHLARGVELWPEDAALREELDELPGLLTSAAGQLWSAGKRPQARTLAQEVLEQLEVTPSQRDQLEGYLR